MNERQSDWNDDWRHIRVTPLTQRLEQILQRNNFRFPERRIKMSIDGGLERTARASRGKRMSKLLSEEEEADEEFWNQDAFKEEEEDNEYEAEDEEADVFDSDFDEDEPEEDEDDAEEDERRSTRKRKQPPGKFSHEKRKNDKKKKGSSTQKSISLVEVAAAAAAGGSLSRPSTKAPRPPRLPSSTPNQENPDINLDPDGERNNVRKSTRTAVVVKQAEREAQQAALQALAKPIIKKKKEEERKITQEEMLLEAAQTEIQNLQALEIMLAREEEVKRKAIIHKATYRGPLIRFHSKDGKNTLDFIKVTEYPEVINSSPIAYPKKVVCVITGQPARYRDPRTGHPYATKEAFKLIRERFDKGDNPGRKGNLEESHQRKRTKVERERPGPGSRTNVAKLKFKKVVSYTTTDEVMTQSKPEQSSPGQFPDTPELEVLGPQHSHEPLSEVPGDLGFSPVCTSNKNNTCGLQLPESSMAHVLSTLDMPGPITEANEADFMLDDLEVSIPSNLESTLSLPTSTSMNPMFLNHDPDGTEARSDQLVQQNMLDISPPDEDQGLLSLDVLPFSDLEALGPSGKDLLK